MVGDLDLVLVTGLWSKSSTLLGEFTFEVVKSTLNSLRISCSDYLFFIFNSYFILSILALIGSI